MPSPSPAGTPPPLVSCRLSSPPVSRLLRLSSPLRPRLLLTPPRPPSARGLSQPRSESRRLARSLSRPHVPHTRPRRASDWWFRAPSAQIASAPGANRLGFAQRSRDSRLPRNGNPTALFAGDSSTAVVQKKLQRWLSSAGSSVVAPGVTPEVAPKGSSQGSSPAEVSCLEPRIQLAPAVAVAEAAVGSM